MVVQDKQLIFSENQVVTVTSQVSTNTYHTDPWAGSSAVDGGNMGAGEPIHGEFIVTETVTSGTGGSTVLLRIVSAEDAALTTNVVTLWSSGNVLKTDYVAGTHVPFTIPQGLNWKKWIGAFYNVSATLTAGKFTCWIAAPGGTLVQVGDLPSGMNFA